MFKTIFLKLFCLHEWESHKEKITNIKKYSQDIIGNITDTGLNEKIITEILICKKCGKITTI